MSKTAKNRPLLEALEPRLLYSADLFGGAHDSSHAGDPLAALLDNAEAGAALPRFESANASAPLELVFVDTDTPGYRDLLDDLAGNADGTRRFEVILIEADDDGLQRLSDTLAEYRDVQALHLISHGDAGRLALGDEIIDTDSLRDNATRITAWRASLTDDADILIYGCDLAADADGRAFVDTLAGLSGADVAASDDLTGAAALGGDWDLEYHNGTIDNDLAISKAAQSQYDATLDITTGLVGRWTFDADASDATTPAYDGVLTGNAAIDTATHPVGAGSLSLDGAGDYVDLTPWRNDIGGLTQGTLSAWVRTSDATNTQSILTIADNTDDVSYSTIGIYQGGLFFDVAEADAYILQAGGNTNIADGSWHHVAVSVDAGGNTFYIDGVATTDLTYYDGTASTTAFFNDVTTTTSLHIGTADGKTGLVWDFNGNLDDVRVFDRALSAADIAELADMPPTALGNQIPVAENGQHVLAASDFNYADADGGTFAGVRVSTLEAAGALTLNGADVSLNQFISRADIDAGLLVYTPTAGQSGDNYASFDFFVNDGQVDAETSASIRFDVTPSTANSITLTPGAYGYTGVVDTDIDDTAPDANNSAATEVESDLNDGSGDGTVQGLLRFDNLFGNGQNQIPLGARIDTATLTLNVTNTADPSSRVELHNLLASWSDTDTWNTLGGGISLDDVEARTQIAALVPTPDQSGKITITGLASSLQSWANGHANQGWVFTNDSTFGWRFSSAEDATIALRPTLTVGYSTARAPNDLTLSEATVVAITNPGFEDDSIPADGDSTSSANGWSTSGPVGTWNPQAEWYTFEAPGGLNIGYIDTDTAGGSLSQALTETFEAGRSYDLSAMVGDESPIDESSGWQLRLYAGTQLLGSVSNSDFDPANGEFVRATLHLDAETLAAFSAQYGQNLVVELYNQGDPASVANVHFDDVKLEYTQIAIPDDTANGTLVATVGAVSDPNTGDSFSYALADDAGGRFAIDPASGAITVADTSLLNWSTATSHDIVARVTDSAGLAYDETITIDVTAAPRTLSGTVYEDINGNGDILDDGVGAAGVTLHLYLDDGANLGRPDSGDSFVASTVSDASGNYSFSGLGTEKYWVVADSKTIAPSAAFNTGFDQGDIWAEQTWGGYGSTYFNGVSYQTSLIDSNLRYGGVTENRSDDAGSLTTAEHLSYLDLNDGDKSKVDFSFSFNVVTDSRDGDDDTAANRGVQGSLRQFIQNGNAIAGVQSSVFYLPYDDAGHVYYQDDGVAGQLSAANITVTDLADASISDFDPDFAHSWYRILPTAALPGIGDSLILDARTQFQYTGQPVVEVDGNGAGAGVNGLTITAGASQVRGLNINSFDGDGIQLLNGAGNSVTDSHIGTDIAGVLDKGNAANGLLIQSANNLIIDNLISGNTSYGISISQTSATDNIIQGNKIGTNLAGDAALPNGNSGIIVLAGASNNLIGGAASGEGNLLSGNGWGGVEFQDNGTSGNRVLGNLIGSDASGRAPLGNSAFGVGFWQGPHDNIVGGAALGEGNLISANTHSGVYISNVDGAGQATRNNIVQGNKIGTDIDGANPNGDMGNQYNGVEVVLGAMNNLIGGTLPGQGNLIMNNGTGVAITDGSAGNAILGNRISENSSLGIDLDDDGPTANDSGDADGGSNALQNMPLLYTATVAGADLRVTGALNSTANTSYRIEFFRNPVGKEDTSGYGEGAVYLGSTSVTTDAAGNANVAVDLVGVNALASDRITATATLDPGTGVYGDTSEFAMNVIPSTPGISVSPTSGQTTTEGGGTASVSFVLDAAPLADVTIALSLSDTAEASLSTNSLTFTPGNWNQTQSVTLTGLQDYTNDGDTAYDLITAAASSTDAAYDGLVVADASLTNLAVANSAPGITNLIAQSIDEDATLTFSSANGNALLVSDGDAGDNPIQISLGANDGILSLSGTTGLSFSDGDGAADASMTFSGKISDINAALDGLSFTPNNNFNGSTSIAIALDDLGNTGSGGALASNASIAIDITPVNDAPTIQALASDPAFTEGDAPVALYTSVSPNTPEAGQTIEALVFSVSGVTDGVDELIGIDGSTISLTDLASGSTATSGYGYDVSLAGSTATVTMTTTGASTADISNLLLGLRYQNSSENPTEANRVFTITRVSDSGGTANGGADTSSPNLVSTVTVVAVNDAPTFTSTGITSATQDAPYSYTIATTDPDGDPLTINASTLPAWLTLTDNGDGTATLSGTPTNADVGNHSVVLDVSDGSLSDTQNFTIAVTNVNDTPTFTSTAISNATQDAAYSYNIATTDPDGDPLSINASTLPAWLTLTDNGDGTATLTGTPTNAEVGNHNVVLEVSDGSLSDTQSFTLAVVNVNDAPSFTSTAITGATQDAAYSYTIATTDPDGDPLTITASTLPAWLTLTDNGDGTATLSGTPTNAEVGNHNAVLEVSDGSLSDSQSFTIAVANVNDAPSFTSTAITGATQDALYSYTIATTDPDGDPLTINATTLPAWLTFTDNGDGTATLSGTPSNAEVGNHNVVLEVSDGSLSASQNLTIAVANVNDAPSFTSTAITGATQDAPYSYTIATTDPDGDPLTITASTLPAWLTFTDNGDGTATLSGTPTNAEVGNHSVVLNVSDGSLSASQSFTIAVTNVNDAPSFTSAAVTAATQDALYSYTIATTDPDGDPLTINATTLPAWLTFTDNGDGTATLSGTPTNAEVGNHNVVLEVSDGSLSDSQSFTIAVVNVNDTPSFTSTAVTAATQDALYSYTIATTDPDGDPLTINATTLPAWLTFTDNGDGTATLSGTPTNAEVGNHNVALEVSDGSLAATQSFTLVVANINDAPAITSDGGGATATINTVENQTSVTTITASDADGDTPSFAISGGADAGLFGIDGNSGTLTFTSAPNYENRIDADNNGIYEVEVSASDGNGGSAVQLISVTVVDVNEAPAFASPTVTNATQDVFYSYDIAASDPDGNPLTINATTLPAWLTFSDNGDGTANLSGTPTNTEVGNHDVVLTVSDGSLSGAQSFTIVVDNTNDAPTITSDGGGATAAINVIENQTSVTTIAASDADGDTPTFSISGGADAGLFAIDANSGVLSFNTAADFENPTDTDNNGIYAVQVSASDGNGGIDTQDISVSVTDINENPAFTSSAITSVPQDALYSYAITTSDPDGNSLTISATSLPAWLTFSDNGDGTATLSGTPTNAEVGTHNVVLEVSDGALSDTQNFAITVGDVNDAPTFTSTAITGATQDTLYSYAIAASDPDGDPLTISATSLPAWLTFSDNGDGTATLSGTPTNAEVGNHNVVLTVSDASLNDTQSFTITVGNSNDAPLITSDGGGATAAITVAENQTGVTTLSASDADGDTPGFSISGGADAGLFTLNATSGTLSFDTARDFENPTDADNNGIYAVEVTASDGNGGSDTQAISVTVTDVNEAPSITSTAATNATRDTFYSYGIVTSDPDGDPLTISATSLPAWLTFSDNGDGTATLSGTPTSAEVGNHNVVLAVSDGSLSDTQSFTLTVNAGNSPPAFDSVAPTTATADQPYSYAISGSDPDGDPLTISASGLPAWLSLTDNGDGTATLAGTPTAGDAGTISILLSLSDGAASDTQSFVLTVGGANGAPIFNSFAPSVITAGQHYQYNILVSDPEGDTLSISASALPAWLSLNDNGDGSATLAGTPGVNDNGNYPISLLASDGVNSVTQQFTLGVAEINHAPSFVSRPLGNAIEEQSYRYQVFARDIDGDALRFSGIQLPSWLTLTPSGPDSAVLSGTPDDPEVGTHSIVLGVSDGSLGAQLRFQITVENVNDAPLIRSDTPDPGIVEDQHIQDGQLVTAGNLHISDADPGESFFVAETLNGTLGQLRVDRDGGWEYTADAAQAAIQQLAAGESLAEHFQLTTADGSRFELTLTLHGSEDAPRVGTPIADQNATQNSPFQLRLPADSFSDVDRSDSLRYAATLADGGALPAWLRFDPASRALSGTPAFADAGRLAIRISADDGLESAAQDFTLNVKALPIPDEPFTASDTQASDDGSHPVAGVAADARPVVGAGASSGSAVDGRIEPISDARADGGRLVLGDATDASSPRAEFITPRPAPDATNPAFGQTRVDPLPLGADTLAELFPDASRETPMPPTNPAIEATPPKPLDLAHLDLNPVKMTPIQPPASPGHAALHNPDFLADLDLLKQDLDQALSNDANHRALKAETVIGLTMSLSVGVVSWVTRAGSLMAAFMSIAPLWKQLDPLPVLGAEGGTEPKRPSPDDENDDDNTSKRVESLFENAESPPRKD